MPHSETGLKDNVRALRRTAGLNQEELAEQAGLSLRVVQKVEGGGSVKVETLHCIARVLGIPTSALFASGAPEPVVDDEANRQSLAELRRALMPPIGMDETLAQPLDAGDLASLARRINDGQALYNADRYDSVAQVLPSLLHETEAAVAAAEDADEEKRAAEVRTLGLALAGKYLTQVRQYDMAYHALAESIRIARNTGNMQHAATGVVGMCWLLLRQDRFDDAEQLAAGTAERVEPRFSTANAGQLAVWGELTLRIAAAAVRNNRPDVATEARRMAATAASAIGKEHREYDSHWARFGPVTVELKAVEDLSLVGNAREVLRRADDGVLSSGTMRKVGKPSTINWNRHRLDVARAHLTLGCTQDAMNELTQVKESSAQWIKHQPMARYIMRDILATRKRTLSSEMREMATHLGVHA